MKKALTFTVVVFLLLWGLLPAQTACTMGNFGSVALLGPSNFPFFSAGTGITINVSAPGVPTLTNFSYTCGAQNFTCASPTWWPNAVGHVITVTFSAPIAKFSVVINGTNQGEIFTFTPNAGTTTLSDYCTAGFSTVAANQLIDNISPATGTLITINNATGATSYTITHNGVGSGSRISLLNCFVAASPFGVNYTNFDAEYRPDLQDVMLRWETSQEINAKGFEVQHSLDGEVWDALGFMDSKGNDNAGAAYNFLHAQPVQGANLYRLRQVDLDGSYDFSEIRTVNMSPDNPEATMYPNPTTGRVQIRAAGRKGNLEVTDLLGRHILSQPFDSQLELDLGTQARGVYIIKITDQHNRTTAQRLELQ